MQVFGETRVNVHALFEQLRREGDLTLVGAEAAISENKWKRYLQHASHLELVPLVMLQLPPKVNSE